MCVSMCVWVWVWGVERKTRNEKYNFQAIKEKVKQTKRVNSTESKKTEMKEMKEKKDSTK